MNKFNIDNWMAAWTPHGTGWTRVGETRGTKAGSIEIGPWPDTTGWSDRYAFTTGCCYIDRHKRSLEHKVMMAFIDFHTMVIRDGIDPQDAHQQFLKIDEYRNHISPDIAGADPE